jgi:acetyl/propionyl-CoA carboxylase alpha subunit
VHYDPMISKLIAWGETREIARRRALIALRNYPILGIKTNTALLVALLEHPRFVSGDFDTRFLDNAGEAIRSSLGTDIPADAIAVAQAAQDFSPAGLTTVSSTTAPDPWTTLRDWRG